MTDLDPKHLDALVGRLKSPWANASPESERGPIPEWIYSLIYEAAEAITALRAENDRLSNLWQIEHDHATALRAQIDRERAATIEAAVSAPFPADWRDNPKPMGMKDQGIYKRGFNACRDAIRALHTDATRAAMDAIRREGYEAGARDSAKLCVSLRKEADRPEAEAVGCMDCASALLALAASIPPNPDTNADSRQQAAPADGEKLQLSERYQAIYEQACARDALDERQGLHLRMGGVVEVCPICDIAGCHHIRDRAAASRQPFAPNATEAECPQPEKWRAGECCGGCLGSSKRPPLSAQVPRLNDDTIPRK